MRVAVVGGRTRHAIENKILVKKNETDDGVFFSDIENPDRLLSSSASSFAPVGCIHCLLIERGGKK